MIRVAVGFILGAVCAWLFFSKLPTIPEKITGVYTDMEFHEESGDIAGSEIFLVKSRQGYFVVFQSSEGSPSRPVVVPARVDGKEIVFELPEKDGDISGVFRGEIYKDSIKGRFMNGVLNKSGSKDFVLYKRGSYWQ